MISSANKEKTEKFKIDYKIFCKSNEISLSALIMSVTSVIIKIITLENVVFSFFIVNYAKIDKVV